jgi:malate dehydrogenase (oxaloacetate-decarboxylating)(NADP+)
MKPMTSAAKRTETKARIIYADGEDERVLRAAQVLIEEGIATPILIGRPSVIDTRLERYGLKVRALNDFEIVDPNSDPRFKDYVELYFTKVGRKGVGPEAAKTVVRTNATVIAALAVERGDADALICGLDGRFERHRKTVLDVTNDPSPTEIANATILSADHIRRFGLVPKAALLSASNFGSRDIPSADKMRKVREILKERAPDLEVDGEMHGDAALSGIFREKSMPNSTLIGEANLLVFPTLDAAHIAMSIIRAMTDALHVGPILLGAAKPAHILTPAVTSRGVVNMSTLAAVEAMSGR